MKIIVILVKTDYWILKHLANLHFHLKFNSYYLQLILLVKMIMMKKLIKIKIINNKLILILMTNKITIIIYQMILH